MLELLDTNDKVVFKTTRQKEMMAYLMKLALSSDAAVRESVNELRIRYTAPVVSPVLEWMNKE